MEMNYEGKLKEFRARCKIAGLGISYKTDLETAYAAIHKSGQVELVLPMPQPLWDKDTWTEWEYMAEHELGHVMPKCIDSYDTLRDKGITPKSFLGACLNLAEDNRQEWSDYYVFKGRRERLNAGRALFLKNQPTDKLGLPGTDDHMLAFQSWYCWDTMIRESWMPAVVGQGERMLKHMTPQQVEWIDKLKAGDYETTLKSGLNAAELYELVLRIITEVFGFDADEEEKKACEPPPEEGAGDGEGEGTPDGDDGDDGAGEVGDAETKGKSTEDAYVKYSDFLAHEHNSDGDREDNTCYNGLHIEYSDEVGAFEYRDPQYRDITDYTNMVAPPSESHYSTCLRETVGSSLAKHTRRLLQVRSASSYQHGLKRGKISPKSIYRAGNKGHPMERRVFKKKVDNNILDTAVSVLCDMSGSMGGSKLVAAGMSCKLLNDAISTIGVPLEITGFDDSIRGVRHSIWKSFRKPVTSDELINRISDSIPRQMSGNSDGESILWAYQRLLAQKQKRKILIVLSDGSPAGYAGDAMQYTKEVVANIEKIGAVEIYAIGIEDTSVSLIYKDYGIIRKAHELEAALLSVITNKILK